jgi:hypothetical protein
LKKGGHRKREREAHGKEESEGRKRGRGIIMRSSTFLQTMKFSAHDNKACQIRSSNIGYRGYSIDRQSRFPVGRERHARAGISINS